MMFSLFKPEIKTVQDADGEEDGTRHQKAPHCVTKAGKDVRQPRCQTHSKEKMVPTCRSP
jgi:hypothetical protein